MRAETHGRIIDEPKPQTKRKKTQLKNIYLKDEELANILSDLNMAPPPHTEIEAMGIWLHKQTRNSKAERRGEDDRTDLMARACMWLDRRHQPRRVQSARTRTRR